MDQQTQSICTVEYNLAIKRSEALTPGTMWTHLEDVMLNERSQTQKVTYYMGPFIGNLQNKSIHKDRKPSRGH